MTILEPYTPVWIERILDTSARGPTDTRSTADICVPPMRTFVGDGRECIVLDPGSYIDRGKCDAGRSVQQGPLVSEKTKPASNARVPVGGSAPDAAFSWIFILFDVGVIGTKRPVVVALNA